MLGLRGPQNVRVGGTSGRDMPDSIGKGFRNIPFMESKRSKVKNKATFH